MPRHKKPKTSEEIIKKAVAAVVLDHIPIREVSKMYPVQKSTISRFVLMNKYIQSVDDLNIPGRQVPNKIFTAEQEQDLEEYLVMASKMHHGLTTVKTRKLAYQYANALKLKVPENWPISQQAGIDWLYGFMKRHPGFSIRTPEATSLSRATSFNKSNVDKFYDNLSNLLERYKFLPNKIYNLDETGCTTVQKPSNVIAKKGTKQIGQITSAQYKDADTTVSDKSIEKSTDMEAASTSGIQAFHLASNEDQTAETCSLNRSCEPLASLGISKDEAITPSFVRPFPKAPPRRTARRGRKPGRTRILTDTPEKEEIELLTEERKKKTSSVTKKICSGGEEQKKIEEKKNVRKRKSQKNLNETDSEESNYELSLRDSSSDNEFDDIQLKLKINDFVLVRFLAKRKRVHYVGVVIVIATDLIEVKINFLKKNSDSFKFFYLEKIDESWVDISDIVQILQPLENNILSERSVSFVSFVDDLSMYNVE